jgi:hypothetical protein
MSDSNTGKPSDMSDAAKAFRSGYDAQIYDQAKVYDALVKTYAENMANTMKPVDYALFNGYAAGLYNAGFREQMDAQAKLHDAFVKAQAAAV